MLVALLKPHGGKVVAFERDPERFKTLKRMLDMAQAKCACSRRSPPLIAQRCDTSSATLWPSIQPTQATPTSPTCSWILAAVRELASRLHLIGQPAPALCRAWTH